MTHGATSKMSGIPVYKHILSNKGIDETTIGINLIFSGYYFNRIENLKNLFKPLNLDKADKHLLTQYHQSNRRRRFYLQIQNYKNIV